jgi:hypothetical protein
VKKGIEFWKDENSMSKKKKVVLSKINCDKKRQNNTTAIVSGT